MISLRYGTMISAFLLILSCSSALCQDSNAERKYEFFGGVSVLGSRTPYSRNVEGWNGSVTIRLAEQWGLFLGSAAYYHSSDNANLCGGIQPCRSGADSYDILLGPVYRPAMLERFRLRPFVRGAVGGVYLTGHSLLPPDLIRPERLYPQRELTFAVGAGGGVDLALAKSVDMRLVQLDCVHRVGGRLYLINLGMTRFSAGLVVRF
jgi:hypothetical protein